MGGVRTNQRSFTYFSACLHPGSCIVRMLNNPPVANPARRRGTARRLSGAATPGPPIAGRGFFTSAPSLRPSRYEGRIGHEDEPARVSGPFPQRDGLAHRDGRRFDRPPSLSGHCGHGPIFNAQRSVANDPQQTRQWKSLIGKVCRRTRTVVLVVTALTIGVS